MRFLAAFGIVAIEVVFPAHAVATPEQNALSRCADAAASWWQGKLGIEFKKIEPERAIRLCEAATRETPNSGDAWAFLARAYNKANRHSEALRATEKAIELGSSEGIWRRGLQFERGYGVKKDLVQAAVWYRKAAKQGHPVAQTNLGDLYKSGKGVGKNVAQATVPHCKNIVSFILKGRLAFFTVPGTDPIILCETATSTLPRDSDAWVSLAIAYISKRRYLDAFLAINKAIELDNLNAFWVFGLFQYFGLDINRDGKFSAVEYSELRAVEAFRHAAKLGHKEASHFLGWYLLTNDLKNNYLTERNFAEAVRWYRAAAEQGYGVNQNFNLQNYTSPNINLEGENPKKAPEPSEYGVITSLLHVLTNDFDFSSANQSVMNKRRRVLERAIHELAELRGPRAIGLLEALLTDEDMEVREIVIDALGELADQRAIKLLVGLLSNEDTDIVNMAVKALSTTVFALSESGEWSLGHLIGPPAIKLLGSFLTSERKDLDVSAIISVLAAVGGQRSKESLLAVLVDKNNKDFERAAAADALAALGESRAIEPIVESLDDGSLDALSWPSKLPSHKMYELSYNVGPTRALVTFYHPRTVDLLVAIIGRTVRSPRNKLNNWQAALMLSTMNNLRAEKPLLALLINGDFTVRCSAAYVLAEMRDPRAIAIEPLSKLVAMDPSVFRDEFRAYDGEPSQIQVQTINALAKFKDPRILEALFSLLASKNINYDQGSYGSFGGTPLKYAVYWGLMGYIALEDPRFVNSFTARLTHDNPVVRRVATMALGKLKDPRALEPLVALLTDKSVEVQNEFDIGFLSNESSIVRREVAYLLGELKDPRALEPLLALLTDKSPEVRRAATMALGELKDPRALEPLLALLTDKSPEVRRAATMALGELKDPRALEPLLAQLTDKSPEVRRAATMALGELKDPQALKPIVVQLIDKSPEVRRAATMALGELKDPRALEPLVVQLIDKSPEVRRAAIMALGELKDPRALEPLVAQLIDKSPEVRRAAIMALGELKDPRAVEPLVVQLIDKSPEVRRAAIMALGELKDPRALEPLVAQLIDKSPEVRRAAIMALGELKDPRAVEPLITMSIDGAFRLNGSLTDVVSALAKLEAFKEQAVQSRVTKIFTVSNLFPSVSDVDRYHRGMLFCVQTIAKFSTYGQRLDLLQVVWRWRDSTLTDYSTEQITEEMGALQASLNKSENLSPYTLLLAAILASNHKRFIEAQAWAERGLANSDKRKTHIRIALSVVRAEALVALGKEMYAIKVLEAVESVLHGRYMPFRQRGGFELNNNYFLPKAELLMTKAFVLSRLGSHREALEASYEAEDLLNAYNRWYWIRLELYEQLKGTRIAPIQQNSHRVEGRRYAQIASQSFNQHSPRDIQQEYGRDLVLQAQVEEAIKLDDLDTNTEVLKKVEKTALAAMPQREDVRFADKSRQRVYDRLVSLQKEVMVLERRLNNAKQKKEDPEQRDKRNSLRKELRKKQRAFHAFIRTLKKKHTDIAARWGKSPTELNQLSKRLNAHTGIVQYLLLDERSYAFVMRHDGSVEIEPLRLGGRDVGRRCPKSQAGKIPCFDLKRKVNRYRALLDSQSKERIEERKRLGETLSRVFLEPIAEHIEDLSHLILVPNGILHRLPFAALPWKKGYLIERKVLKLLPASSLVGAVSAKPVNPRGMLALGNPVVRELGWRELKWAEAEVDALAKHFPDLSPKHKHILKRKEARRDSLVDQDLDGYLLHFAAHGESGKKNREARLLLSGGDLTYYDIIGLYIKDAPLVVLSACDTGLGERLSGDEVYSLANAFLHAQARAVVFSLWLVDDLATSMLMGEFYSHYASKDSASKGDVATSLAKAQRAMIRKGRPPAHWAGFVLSQWSAPKS